MAGRVVVVTGASAGVGRTVAQAFGAKGDAVALVARGQVGLDAAAKDVEALGPIDIWVNVAFTPVFAPFTKIEPEEFKRVTEVAYLGYVYGTRAALDRMLPRGRGTIVQVGSALAYRGIPLQSAYCGAKHAIQGFNEALRCELLHDHSRVRVTMVQLPGVNTPSSTGCSAGCPTTPNRSRPSTNPRWPPGRSCTRPPILGAGSTELVAAPSEPWSPTSSPPGCWTATWPAPATALSRATSPPTRTGRSTCGRQPTAPAAATLAPMAPSTLGPRTTAPSCGCPSTTGCWPPSVAPSPPAWPPSSADGGAADAPLGRPSARRLRLVRRSPRERLSRWPRAAGDIHGGRQPTPSDRAFYPEGGLSMNYAKQPLDTYPRDFNLDDDLLAAAIEALSDCAQACTACADDCLSEQQVAELVKCIRLNLDCADVCTATLRVVSRQTASEAHLTGPQLQACVAACRSCGKECERHAQMHEHCRACADACRRCGHACNELLATMR